MGFLRKSMTSSKVGHHWPVIKTPFKWSLVCEFSLKMCNWEGVNH